ncbi:MAG: hypothetical protein HON90_12290 [Halobacteriovoraceae bacterium]|nr:hypothetical protein [Halobacteriovoraceae bacterium]
MEHSLKNLITFSSSRQDSLKHQKIQSFHYDHSGHVVATNSHVLFATKKPWEIEKAGRTYSKFEFEKGSFVEAELEFPSWKQFIPQESGRKITIKVPAWFELFKKEDYSATMVLDYTDITEPFFKISESTSETSLGFNAKYLACFANEEITVLVTSPLSPAIIVCKDSDIDPLSLHFKDEVLKEDWFYILMPIKLDEDLSDEVYL